MTTYNNCTLCPRECSVDRSKSTGYCMQSDKIKIARAALHKWEEPCICTGEGCGAVFFSGCTLRCCYCQNYEISHDNKGFYITERELADIFLKLRDEGACCIDLVSPTPFVPSIISALDLVKSKLGIPIVYNCGGYESQQTLDMLSGYIDIYLPDLKYFSSEYSAKYSGCKDYFEHAMPAIVKMQKQVGKPAYNENGQMIKGVIVRHLALPTLRHDSANVLKALRDNFEPDDIVLSLMSQYVPVYKALEHREINRKISTFEYNYLLDTACDLGFEGYSQQRDASSEAYIPKFYDDKDGIK